MRKYDPDSMNYEFHIIMELMDGDNMEDYLDEQGPALTLDQVK